MKKITFLTLISLCVVSISCKKDKDEDPNAAPSVEITAPYDGDIFGGNSGGTSINVTINSSDSDGSVSKLEVFDGTTLVNTVTSPTSPYSYTGAFAVGNHSLTVKATDNEGATTTSAAVDFTVQNNVVIMADIQK